MKNRTINVLTKASDFILTPISKNSVFFVCQFFIMIIPSLLNYSIDLNYKGVFAEVAPYIYIYIFDAYIFATIFTIFNKIVIKVILYSITLITSAIESFVIIFYQTRINPTIIRLIRETNKDEILGFFSTIDISHFLCIICVIIILILIIIYLESINTEIKYKNKYIFISVLLVSICYINIKRNYISIIAYLKCDSTVQITHYKRKNNVYPDATTSYGHIIYSLALENLAKQDISKLKYAIMQTKINESNIRSKKIVLVIGESFNKHHSNLYQYKLNTNHNLKLEVESENLYIFNDVITPFCSTSLVMQQIFTLKSQDDKYYWANTPLVASIFLANEYNTMYYSNQEVKDNNKLSFYHEHFLVSSEISNMCYTQTNTNLYQLDNLLIDEYKSNCNSIIDDKHLAIFHLYGQHFPYKTRYPNNEIIFTANDYQYRTDLTQTQRETIAHYDNATAYNDKVIANIIDLYRDQDAIIIYLSDHGEEVYDYRNFIGRTPTAKLTPEICKYQFEIPFMIWMSDEYKSTHPDVVKQVENSLDKPFMIDDLPHLMLDIAGIDCEWFDPTRSLINERYNANRKRLLLDSKIDYDEIIKQLKK